MSQKKEAQPTTNLKTTTCHLLQMFNCEKKLYRYSNNVLIMVFFGKRPLMGDCFTYLAGKIW